jgi:hypothetical protein
MALGSIQNLTEMSTRNIPGGKGLSAENLTAICELIVCIPWEPWYLTTLEASTACYGDSFTLWRWIVLPVRYELDCKYCYK